MLLLSTLASYHLYKVNLMDCYAYWKILLSSLKVTELEFLNIHWPYIYNRIGLESVNFCYALSNTDLKIVHTNVNSDFCNKNRHVYTKKTSLFFHVSKLLSSLVAKLFTGLRHLIRKWSFCLSLSIHLEMPYLKCKKFPVSFQAAEIYYLC